ncbi:MAG: hypothetical protein EZS28_052790, partial [Streblomastix strix]
YICSEDILLEGCQCPVKAEELKGIPSKTCRCLPHKEDIREECQPTLCTSWENIPDQGCICNQAAHPEDCYCSNNPKDLVGILKTQCACVEDDLRGQCFICKGVEKDDPDCICPTDLKELRYISKKLCDCVPDDLREECIPVGCTSEDLPTEGCICTAEFHPDNCICPWNVSEIDGIPKDQCDCLFKDPRKSCLTCQGLGEDDPDCICPEKPFQLIYFDIEKCPCIETDERGECYTCSKDILLDGCKCPEEADQLKGIPRKVCECLAFGEGDTRDECKPQA